MPNGLNDCQIVATVTNRSYMTAIEDFKTPGVFNKTKILKRKA